MKQMVTVPVTQTLYLPMDNGTTLKLTSSSATWYSTEWSFNSTLPPNTTEVPVRIKPCLWILDKQIGNSRVRIWDVIILIPNVLFLLFLVLKLRTTYAKFKHTNSPIFFSFYAMVFLVAVISVLRCIVSMTVNAALEAGDIADKILWLILRFFLLATELSVVTFGLAFGHMDSKKSIRMVLLVTSSLALVYSVVQGALEFTHPDKRFRVGGEGGYDIFGHGGMIFWMTSSILFFVVYSVIFFLPYTKIKQKFTLPPKRSFYLYCLFLACLNLIQAIGSGLLYFEVHNGLCVVDLTTYIYFTLFAPLVYLTFLRDFFRNSQPPNILFSYKAQVDDPGDEDHLSMPHQIKNDDEPSGPVYDSTHFGDSPNPLYAADLQANFDSAVLSINTDQDRITYDKTHTVQA